LKSTLREFLHSISYNNLIGIRLNPLSIIQCFLYIVYLTEIWINSFQIGYHLLILKNKQNAFLYNFAIGSYAVYFLYLFFLWRNENDFPKVLLILDRINIIRERD
jgi:hypothetical protein